MRRIQSTLFTLLAASSTAYADTTLNLTPGVSPISHDVYDLHMLIFWICCAIGLVVFSAMFYSIIHHRKSKGHKAAHFHSHLYVEIAWTIVPAIILIGMAFPATKVLLNMNNEAASDMTIQITGYQWKWHYKYLEDGLSFFSNNSTPQDQINGTAPKDVNYLREVDNPLVVPIHKKIRFLITSNDVNHAWWVPDFGVKRDAVGGFINEAWAVIDKPGTYRGQCAELCGINHAFMPIVVIALSEQGYADWVAQQKGQATQGAADIVRPWTKDELMKKGEETYNGICAACHQPGGVGLPPTFPALKGSKVATGPLPKHLDTVMNGVSGTAMQAFKNQLSEVQIASVITFERNSWGNNMGDMVQPIQVQAYKNGKTIDEALATQPSATPAAAAPATGTPAAQPAAPASNGAAAPAASAPARPAAVTGPVPVNTNVKAAPAAQPVAAPQAPAAQPAAPAQPTAPAQPAMTPGAQPVAAAGTDDMKTVLGRGEKIYLSHCAACHQPTGLGIPPTFPALKGSPIATGPVAGHLDRVLNGKTGTAMVPFKDQLKDQELADVITYERNSFGNSDNKIVTAADVNAARNSANKQ